MNTIGARDSEAGRSVCAAGSPLGFITVMLKDMRNRCGGRLYGAQRSGFGRCGALFEDGLSDGRDAVRVLAGRGPRPIGGGRNQPRLRNALADQAGLVKARAVKVLGKSNDPRHSAARRRFERRVDYGPHRGIWSLGEAWRQEAWEQFRSAAEAPIGRSCRSNQGDGRSTRYAWIPIMTESLASSSRPYGERRREAWALEGRRRGTRSNCPSRSDAAVRESAAAGLADLGGTESVPARADLQDGTMTVRAARLPRCCNSASPMRWWRRRCGRCATE